MATIVQITIGNVLRPSGSGSTTVIDNLTSTSTTSALSANQGRVLNEKIVAIPEGPPGESAYQIWLDAGNTGTEADFLASLKGAKGDTGEQGQQGPPGNDGAPGRSIQVLNSIPTGQFGTDYFAGDVVML